MAPAGGRTDPSLEQILLDSPWEFSFFQAVRLLTRLYPGVRLISAFKQPLDEGLRFRSHLSLQFPPSEIQSIVPDPGQDGRLAMTVNFMGLTGPQGALPTHYTEYLIARSQSRDSAAAAFFDLFNHRLISLFYLAWEKHRFAVGYEREAVSRTGSGRFTQYLFDLIGMGTPGLRERYGQDGIPLLSYAGLLGQHPRSAVALAGMLRDYFQVSIEIRQFLGQWCPIEEGNRSYLGDEGIPNQLGSGAILGDQVWNQQAIFSICVGPLNWERFNRFLPDGPAFAELVKLVRFFVNGILEFEVRLILRAAEVPWCVISDDPTSPRLGESTWLKTGDFTLDAGDFVISSRSLAR